MKEFSTPAMLNMVGATSFCRSSKMQELYDINRRRNCRVGKITPEEYHDFLPLFSQVAVQNMPPHCQYDHSGPSAEKIVLDGFAGASVARRALCTVATLYAMTAR